MAIHRQPWKWSCPEVVIAFGGGVADLVIGGECRTNNFDYITTIKANAGVAPSYLSRHLSCCYQSSTLAW